VAVLFRRLLTDRQVIQENYTWVINELLNGYFANDYFCHREIKTAKFVTFKTESKWK